MDCSQYTHIVDGSCALEHLRNKGFLGAFIDWLDVLHDGPLRGGPDWDLHVSGRANYLESMGMTSAAEAEVRLSSRFTQLEASRASERVIWLTAELFDQLQLLELLAWLTDHDHDHDLERMMLVDLATSVPLTTGDQLTECFANRKALQPLQLKLAQGAWSAVKAAHPHAIAELLKEDLGPLPYLHAALLRYCREFPHQSHGLGMTQFQALDILAEGPLQPGPLFRRVGEREEVPFMGDASFWWRVKAMAKGREPLLATTEGPLDTIRPDDFLKVSLVLTKRGEQVRAGMAFWKNPEPPWIGGCNLSTQTWLWNEAQRQFTDC